MDVCHSISPDADARTCAGESPLSRLVIDALRFEFQVIMFTISNYEPYPLSIIPYA
jgi:hypothetical protein